jgi:hypothetical protein
MFSTKSITRESILTIIRTLNPLAAYAIIEISNNNQNVAGRGKRQFSTAKQRIEGQGQKTYT